jgi:hypothetical protein
MEHDNEVMFKHRKIEQEEIARIKTIRASRECILYLVSWAAVKLQCIAGGGLFEMFCNISEKSQQKLQ